MKLVAATTLSALLFVGGAFSQDVKPDALDIGVVFRDKAKDGEKKNANYPTLIHIHAKEL